jgi:hypothetical protein
MRFVRASVSARAAPQRARARAGAAALRQRRAKGRRGHAWRGAVPRHVLCAPRQRRPSLGGATCSAAPRQEAPPPRHARPRGRHAPRPQRARRWRPGRRGRARGRTTRSASGAEHPSTQRTSTPRSAPPPQPQPPPQVPCAAAVALARRARRRARSWAQRGAPPQQERRRQWPWVITASRAPASRRTRPHASHRGAVCPREWRAAQEEEEEARAAEK